MSPPAGRARRSCRSIISALVKAAGFDEAVVVVNVGGVANLTYVDDGPPIAFDTGPGNALIDDMMFSRAGEKMDIGGTTAAEGKIDFTALGRIAGPSVFRAAAAEIARSQCFLEQPRREFAVAGCDRDSDGADRA